MGLKIKSLTTQEKSKLVQMRGKDRTNFFLKKMLCAKHRLGTTAPEFVEEAGEDQRRGRRKLTR
jgi:hypothetical protein